MNDMAASQLDSGLVPDIAPEYVVFDGGFRDSPEWGQRLRAGAVAAVRVDGGHRAAAPLLRQHDAIRGYLGSKAKDHIVSHGLGDWYDIGPNRRATRS
jgi:hypothetical protein